MDVRDRRGADARFGGHEARLQLEDGVSPVRLQEAETTRRSQDTDGFGEHRLGTGDMVQQIADEYRAKGPVAKRERSGVGGAEGDAGHPLSREGELGEEAVDAHATHLTGQTHQVVALPATDLQAQTGDSIEHRGEQGVFGFRKARRPGGPAEALGIGPLEVTPLNFVGFSAPVAHHYRNPAAA